MTGVLIPLSAFTSSEMCFTIAMETSWKERCRFIAFLTGGPEDGATLCEVEEGGKRGEDRGEEGEEEPADGDDDPIFPSSET
jgi:hypothetical protein